MHWQQLYSNKRFNSRNLQKGDEVRGDYMRDYDRLIFSSQFRRLQNKTQVFPLPGASFVHNRLTHSLEVASVGRSLGKAAGAQIAEVNASSISSNASDFYRFELSDVIQTACLAHDIGNPPFGHSGEEAIRTFFKELPDKQKGTIRNELSDSEWKDFTRFEGNANAFRILSSIFLKNGLKLTFTSLASIVKYPVDSYHGFDKSLGGIATKKSGFFEAEKAYFTTIAEELGIPKWENYHARHPFVYLVEAADDICYSIIDLEDAFRLNIVSFKEVETLLLPFFEKNKNIDFISKTLKETKEDKQKLAFLRALLINELTQKCTQAFVTHEKQLLNGSLNQSLIDLIDDQSQKLLKEITTFSVQKIYNHQKVIEKEIAGYHVIGGLLTQFVEAALEPKRHKSAKILQLLQGHYAVDPSNGLYENLLHITDYISGMTDIYAVELFRKITGIQIPEMG